MVMVCASGALDASVQPNRCLKAGPSPYGNRLTAPSKMESLINLAPNIMPILNHQGEEVAMMPSVWELPPGVAFSADTRSLLGYRSRWWVSARRCKYYRVDDCP